MAPQSPDAAAVAARYDAVARALHWIVAGAIALQFLLAQLAELAEHGGERLRVLALLANHKSVGLTILALAALRVVWRLVSPPPPLPATMPAWQRHASRISHWSLYGLLFAMPVTGWLMSSASAYSVSWFGLFTLPDLIDPSERAEELFEEIHETLAKVLIVVVSLHVIAALKHHFIDRDTVLRRMSSWPTVALMILVFAVGALWLTGAVAQTAPATADPGAVDARSEPDRGDQADTDQPESKDTGPRDSAAPAETDTAGAAALIRPWAVDYRRSFIRFTAEQAGAPFTGEWTDWSADIRFDAGVLDESEFVVDVRVAGVETRDDERDEVLMEAEWFDAAEHPTVTFRTDRIRAGDDGGYVADAIMTVKGETHPVSFRFDVRRDGDRLQLDGAARLDRIALGVGMGEWRDTRWIGRYVDVDVRVTAPAG